MAMIRTVALALVVLSFLAAVLAYPQMPERAASHWNMAGQADGYSSREVAVFLLPAISALVYGLLTLLPRLDPLRKNYAAFQKEYDGMIALMAGFFFYIYLLSIAHNLGFAFNFSQAIAPAFGALFFYMGMVMEKAKQNWFVGIRTPWTLSNPAVWDRTHALAGKLFKAAGAVAVVGLILPEFFIASVALVIAGSVACVAYSYLEFDRMKGARKER